MLKSQSFAVSLFQGQLRRSLKVLLKLAKILLILQDFKYVIIMAGWMPLLVKLYIGRYNI